MPIMPAPMSALRSGTDAQFRSLAGIELFEDLPPDAIESIAHRCHWRRYAAGQDIINQDDPNRDVFFIISGTVRVILYSPAGKQVNLRDLGAGETFGELAAIDGEPRSANVSALSESVLAALPSNTFWQILAEHPAVAARALKRLARLVRQLSERIYEFSTLAVRDRLYTELLRLTANHLQPDGTAVIVPAPTHADLASRISTHREAVTRELGHLSRRGIVQRRRNALIVSDLDRLARLCGDGDA
jgi:CRP-like cAMP-binding protein